VSERYWLYEEGAITGPFLPEELMRTEGFTSDSALCPEELRGTMDESWARAGETPGISQVFPPSERAPKEGRVGPWPPDPEGRDIDPIGSVSKRFEAIDRTLEAAQDRLGRRNDAYEKLREELKSRLGAAADLEERIRGMAARMGGFLGMREEIDQARAALAMHEKRAAEIKEEMETSKKGKRSKRPKRTRKRRSPDPHGLGLPENSDGGISADFG